MTPCFCRGCLLQLGVIGTGTALLPTAVAMPESATAVTQAIAGDEHSIILTQDGCVFGFGRASNGQISLDADAKTPVRLLAMRQFKVLQASAGLAHTMLLTEAGEPFAMGSNRSGQLGRRVPAAADGSYELADVKQCYMPQRVAGLAGTRIVQVTLSLYLDV